MKGKILLIDKFQSWAELKNDIFHRINRFFKLFFFFEFQKGVVLRFWEGGKVHCYKMQNIKAIFEECKLVITVTFSSLTEFMESSFSSDCTLYSMPKENKISKGFYYCFYMMIVTRFFLVIDLLITYFDIVKELNLIWACLKPDGANANPRFYSSH